MVIQQLMNMGNGGSSRPTTGTKTPQYKGKTGFPRTLTYEDFAGSTNVDVNSGRFNLIGEFVVGAQQLAEVGQGDASLDPREQGLAQIDFQNSTPDPIDGFVLIRHESAQDTNLKKVVQNRTEEFRTTTRSERIVLPRASTQGKPLLGEDSKIALYLNPDSNDTVDSSETTVRVPVTIYE